MPEDEPTYRFSLLTLFAFTTYFAIVCGVWKALGADWAILLVAPLYFLLLTYLAKITRRRGLVCPECQKAVLGLLLNNNIRCPGCGTKLVNDFRTSIWFSIGAMIVCYLLFISFDGEISPWYKLTTMALTAWWFFTALPHYILAKRDEDKQPAP